MPQFGRFLASAHGCVREARPRHLKEKYLVDSLIFGLGMQDRLRCHQEPMDRERVGAEAETSANDVDGDLDAHAAPAGR